MINGKNRVIVIGDIMLDQYNSGVVNRISPESPVPIVKIQERNFQLGGAANVANNIVSLGGDAAIIGAVGNDYEGKKVVSLLKEKNILVDEKLIIRNYRTIKKVRILGNQQQIARMDYNENQKLPDEDLKGLLQIFENIFLEYDVVILSDYAKGICTERICQYVIKKCREEGKRILVDPKGSDWKKYKGASLISPNLKEMSEYLGCPIQNSNIEIENKCYSLQTLNEIEYLMITRSEKGITLIDKDNQYFHMESKAKEVYDVSGAGDTVIATLGLFWGKERSIMDAIRLSNDAAGIVVGKKGTATVTEAELEERKRTFEITNKIVTQEQIMENVKAWKKSGESIVFTNGCYDIFHKGHVYSVYEAAKLAKHLIVGVNSDCSVRKLKGSGRPVNSERDRAYMIAALGCVDNVVIFNETTPELLIKEIRPDVLVKGGDYRAEDVIGKEYAGRVELIQYLDGYSTTRLIQQFEGRNAKT